MKMMMRPITGESQVLAISSTSASVTGVSWPGVRVVSTVDCFIRLTIGASVAVTTDMFLPAGMPEYLNRDSCDTLSAVTSGATGSLYVSDMG